MSVSVPYFLKGLSGGNVQRFVCQFVSWHLHCCVFLGALACLTHHKHLSQLSNTCNSEQWEYKIMYGKVNFESCSRVHSGACGSKSDFCFSDAL